MTTTTKQLFLMCCLSLLFAGGLDSTSSAAGDAAQQHADLVLLNGRVVTVDKDQPAAEAVAVQGNKVIAVGKNEEIKSRIGDTTKVVQMEGRLLIPGFIESHGHFLSLGEARMMLDLSRADTWDDIIRLVGSAVKDAEDGQWIVGRGWHQAKWRRPPEPNVEGYPTHTQLSRISTRNPVLLTHASGHMCFANKAAMKLAGINRDSQDPQGGEILRDASGDPTGIFRETAQAAIHQAHASSLRNRTADEHAADLLRAIDLATAECLQNGVTTFHDAGVSFGTVDRFRELAERGKLRVRMWMMIRASNGQLKRELARYRTIGFGDNFLTVRAIKRSIDGALGAHGAWLLEPYDDLPSSVGLNTSSIASIRETARLAVQHDFQLCVHAIGDRANRETLNIFAAAVPDKAELAHKRWRIEHAQHLHASDIPRFKQLGVIASMQGVHCTSDAVFVIRRLGQRRAGEGAYVWRKLLDSGAIVCNGTDAPVEDVNPILCFHSSVTRRMPNGVAFFAEQCMSREQALRSYTLDAAYAAFEEDDKGSITPGKLADMVVLSKDIMTCPAEQIPEAEVDITIVGGKLVYQRRE